MKSLLDNYCIWCKITTFLLDNYQKRLFFGLFYDLEDWDFILIFAPNPRGHSSICQPKTVRFIPTRQKFGFNIWSIDHKLPKGSQPKGKGILIRLSPILEKMFLGTQNYYKNANSPGGGDRRSNTNPKK